MATGLYLKQLLTVCSSATALAAINSALTAQSMDAVLSIQQRPVIVTKPLKRPIIVLGLRPDRDRYSVTADPEQGRIEDVVVEFEIQVYEEEHEAAAYEGVVLETLLGLKATIVAGVTDADVVRWEAIEGTSDMDEDATNKQAWTAVVAIRAQIEVR